LIVGNGQLGSNRAEARGIKYTRVGREGEEGRGEGGERRGMGEQEIFAEPPSSALAVVTDTYIHTHEEYFVQHSCACVCVC